MSNRTRLTVLVSHPIQYQTPLFRFLNQHTDLDLHVLFMSDFSVRGYVDREFNVTVDWGKQILEGFSYEFLPTSGPNDEAHPIYPIVKGLSRFIKGKTDVLFTMGYSQLNCVRALAIAHRNHITTFTRSDIIPTTAVGTGWRRKLKDAYVQNHFKKIDCFLASSSLNETYYRRQGVPDSRIFMVPHAVDNAFFQARSDEFRPQRDEIRTSFGLNPTETVILWAHKLIAKKSVQDMLAAHARLCETRPNDPPTLLLGGDGEDRPLVESWIAAHPHQPIKFIGFQDQIGMAKCMVASDLFAITSDKDPFGLVVNEAMNTRLPVVSSDGVGAAPDLVIPGKTGAIYPKGDVNALANVLADLTADKARLHQLGENALAHINTWSFRENVTGIAAALRSKGHPIQTEFD